MILKIILIFTTITKILCDECQCGKIEINVRQKRIHQGNVAQEGRFPWQIYLQITNYKSIGGVYNEFYGGVLISKKHVLTCAKCVDIFFQA